MATIDDFNTAHAKAGSPKEISAKTDTQSGRVVELHCSNCGRFRPVSQQVTPHVPTMEAYLKAWMRMHPKRCRRG